MFGIRIMLQSTVRDLVRLTALETAHACHRLAEPRGLECEGDYGRGRGHAARDIEKLIQDLRK